MGKRFSNEERGSTRLAGSFSLGHRLWGQQKGIVAPANTEASNCLAEVIAIIFFFFFFWPYGSHNAASMETERP